MDLKVPDAGGCHQTPLDHRTGKTSHEINDLQTSLDVHRFPWIDAVERVMGIEPTLEAWEAAVLPLNYTRIDRNRLIRKDLR